MDIDDGYIVHYGKAHDSSINYHIFLDAAAHWFILLVNIHSLMFWFWSATDFRLGIWSYSELLDHHMMISIWLASLFPGTDTEKYERELLGSSAVMTRQNVRLKKKRKEKNCNTHIYLYKSSKKIEKIKKGPLWD